MGNCQQACNNCSKEEIFREEEIKECQVFTGQIISNKPIQTPRDYNVNFIQYCINEQLQYQNEDINQLQNKIESYKKINDNNNLQYNSEYNINAHNENQINNENLDPNPFQNEYNENKKIQFDQSLSLQDQKLQNYTTIEEFPQQLNTMVEKLLQKLGEFEYDQEIQGHDIEYKGPVMFTNGSIYLGQMKQDKRHGKGKQLWQHGSLYEGYWYEDVACGKGRLIHSDGDVYYGEWLDDKAHGKGIYLHSDGSQHGYGIETWVDGTKYEGDYQFGKKHGKGFFSWIDGSTYEGDFFENCIQGTGTYYWIDGREFIGEWKDNKMNGKGIFKFPDGRVYEGEYLDDKKHGYGEFYWPDGRLYKGDWQNGKQNGFGVLTYQDGTVLQGQWENGKLKLKENQKTNQKQQNY